MHEQRNAESSSRMSAHDAPSAASCVVGIGASTGGLDALKALFAQVPGDAGAAFVVVVHLSPAHESHLVELLQPHCALPITQVTATTALEPHRVYVIPPNANLNVIDTHVRLSQIDQRPAHRAPIDHFLRTLAAHHADRSAAVILTGAGADGTLGLRLIRGAGGLAVAQDPDDAEEPSMPRSAIATGMVDFVLRLRDIAPAVLRFCSTRPQLGRDAHSDAAEEQLLNEVRAELRVRGESDGEMYRRAFLVERVRRRMQLHGIEGLPEYVGVLRTLPRESAGLVKDLRLNVTEFFRGEVFARLERSVVPRLLRRAEQADGRLRIWSVGCSTGEEAYSLAMLLLEQAELLPARFKLQIFATELGEETLAPARNGLYPAGIATHVSERRLERFFVREGDHYRVRRHVRDMIVFAVHNPLRDPPFGHIDLVVCRNVLGDLRTDVHRDMLGVFHYALQRDGLLVADPADTIAAGGLFVAEEPGLALFRKLESQFPLARPRFARHDLPEILHTRRERRLAESRRTQLHERAVLRAAPPSVLVDTIGEVLHYSPSAGRYLRLPGGTPTASVLELVREPLRAPLDAALTRARAGVAAYAGPVSVELESGGTDQVMLRAAPAGEDALILISLEKTILGRGGTGGSVHDASTPAKPAEARAMGEVGEELDVARRGLDDPAVRTESERSTRDVCEELSYANEELHSANGELYFIMQQLESSKEELQVLNEELVLLDKENRRRLEEVARTSSELQHLLESTGIATLFLDGNLNIVRFTPQVADIFNIRRSDHGRPLADLTHRLGDVDLEADVCAALRERTPIKRELRSSVGRWYSVHSLVHRIEPEAGDGVVMTFVDITERKHAEEALIEVNRRKDEFLATLAHELRNPLAPISAGLEVVESMHGDPRAVADVCITMKRQVQQLVHLVDDLLDVSRIGGGRLRLRKSRVELADVVRDAIATVQPLIAAARHELAVSLPDAPVVVDADAARLTQVLANVLGNAAKYTGIGGRITLTVERGPDEAIVRIVDTGVGISAEHLPRIFDLFFSRADDAPGESGIGLGIGLTLARSLVEMHGGTLTADSAGRDQGSTFVVRLPVTAAAASPAGPAVNGSRERLNGHRILIVDDNQDAAKTLGMLVKMLGENDVRVAYDGHEALRTAAEIEPDIVLLDIGMPLMNGYEVARRLRREPWGECATLVALTGWGQEEDKRRSREAGFDRHLVKPAGRDALAEILAADPPSHVAR